MVGRHTPRTQPHHTHAHAHKPAARLKQAVYFDCPGFRDCMLNSYCVVLHGRYVMPALRTAHDTNLATVIVISDRPSLSPIPESHGFLGRREGGLAGERTTRKGLTGQDHDHGPGPRDPPKDLPACCVRHRKQRHERGTGLGTRARPVQTRCPRVPDAGVVFWDGFQSCFAVSKDDSARTVWDLTRRGDCDAGSIANVYWLW